MKKKAMIGILTLVVMCAAACGATKSELEFIGADTAQTKALHAAGLEGMDVPGVSSRLEERDGKSYYNVNISTDGAEYTYDIDALSGAIIASNEIRKGGSATPGAGDIPSGEMPAEVPEIADRAERAVEPEAVSAPTPAASKTAPAPAESKAAPAPAESKAAPAPAESKAAPVPAESKAAPAPAAGMAAPTPAAGMAAPVPTQASGGDSRRLSEAEAKQIALSRVPGATAANFVKFKMDHDDGRVEYEGEILYQGWEYDFEIDAYSGAVRDWDAEPYDD